jgi:hypothetical protein
MLDEFLKEKCKSAGSVYGETIEQIILNGVNRDYGIYNREKFIFPLKEIDAKTEYKFCINPFYNLYANDEKKIREVTAIFDKYIKSVEDKEGKVTEKADWLKKLYEICHKDSIEYKKEKSKDIL